jgi:hypothetical protein
VGSDKFPQLVSQSPASKVYPDRRINPDSATIRRVCEKFSTRRFGNDFAQPPAAESMQRPVRIVREQPASERGSMHIAGDIPRDQQNRRAGKFAGQHKN